MTKTEQLEELFKKWQKRQIEEEEKSCKKTILKNAKVVKQNSFCKDGIICEEEYSKQKIKVLFIANEPNIETDEDIEKVENGATINPISSQIKEFKKYYEDDPDHYDDWKGKLRYRLSTIIYPAIVNRNLYDFPVADGWKNANKFAFMNLNKRGGKAEIRAHLKHYCKYYIEQIIDEISIIDPDIIVWLGYGSYNMCFEYAFKDTSTFDNDRIFLNIKGKSIPLLKIEHTSAYISDFNRAQEVRNEMNKHRECIEKLINE